MTTLYISLKQVIQLPIAVAAASLSTLSFGYNQVYEVTSSLFMGIFFKFLSSAGLMYTIFACKTSFGRSQCYAVHRRQGARSPYRDTMQCMHDWINSLTLNLMSFHQ